jgi:citrate synthase
MLLTARQAAERLGIKLDTLYAYVSRGRLRSIGVPGTRQRRYRAAEVEALRASGANPRSADPDALMPVIGSSICLIENGTLYYLGQDAIGLSVAATLEDVATLLWRGEGTQPVADMGRTALRTDLAASVGLIERCQIRLAQLADKDLPALDLTRAGVIRTGWRILRELAGCVAVTRPAPGLIHHQLATAWKLNVVGADILRRCLVLVADHELNASTFVARCVASTHATPYAVVSAALAALSGRRHGGASAQVEALFGELAQGGDPLALMAARIARNEMLPGLGQPLYPAGHPRATAILDRIAAALPEAWARIEPAVAAGTRLTGQYPNVDFALAAVTTALALPQNSALGLFVVGRTVGWIAHAIEQYESGTLIRPRARYYGPRPPETPESG